MLLKLHSIRHIALHLPVSLPLCWQMADRVANCLFFFHLLSAICSSAGGKTGLKSVEYLFSLFFMNMNMNMNVYL